MEQSDRLCQQDEWSLENHMEMLKGKTETNEKLENGNALELPEWFDLAKFQRGQEFFKKNYYACFVSKLCGLLAILTIPEISQILVMTAQSSEPKTSFKRYLSTICHMLMWYDGEPYNPLSWSYKSLKEVHNKHKAANNKGKKEGIGAISQASLALTQFGFMGYAILVPTKLGITDANDENLTGFIHFWRTIGYMVGIQDRFNICRESVSETKALCSEILNQMINPVFKEPFQDFTNLSVALLKGMWAIVPEIDVEAFSTYVKYLSNLPVEKCTNWYSRFMFDFQIFVHETLLKYAIFRWMLNTQMWLTIVLTVRFPLLAYYAFGIPLKSQSIRL